MLAENSVQSVFHSLCTQIIKPQTPPKTTKSVLTQTHIKQKIQKHETQNFQRISPFGIAPVKKKKYIRLGHAGIVDHFVNYQYQIF